jgi:hypothetical protein
MAVAPLLGGVSQIADDGRNRERDEDGGRGDQPRQQ